MNNTLQELSYIKNDYKRAGNTTQNKKEKKTGAWVTILLLILDVILKITYWVLVGFFQICIAIFMIIIFTPLYMFFGVKPVYRKKRRW